MRTLKIGAAIVLLGIGLFACHQNNSDKSQQKKMQVEKTNIHEFVVLKFKDGFSKDEQQQKMRELDKFFVPFKGFVKREYFYTEADNRIPPVKYLFPTNVSVSSFASNQQ